MRVIVIGGSGRTGRLVVEKLLADKHQVVATIRNARHMPALVKLGAEVVVIDLDSSPLADLEMAAKGADAMVFAAGSAEGESSAIDSKGTRRTLLAASKTGVKRYISISSIGASTGLSTRGMSDEMKDYYKAKRAAGKAIVASDLAWTIVEPGELIDDPGTGKVTLSTAAVELGSVSRDDVAAVVVAVLGEPKSAGHVLQLIAGKNLIKTALARALG